MCIFNKQWYSHYLTRIASSILLLILLPLSLWVALMPLDHYVFTITFSDKVLHFVVFFGFALLADIALINKSFWSWYGLPLIAYGALIEILQSFTPYRSFSTWDWLADLMGVVIVYLILVKCKSK